ncbi:oligosaccharide flippase family protein [Vibrio sp. 2-Bac 85]
MYSKFRDFFYNYKTAIQNAGYLTCLQVLSLVFPLITYPHLIKTLGTNLYGEIILAQGAAFLLCAFVSYGFNLSATRKITKHKRELKSVSNIFTATIVAKFVIFLPALMIFITYIYCVKPSELHVIYLLCVGPLIYEVFFPTWLFQGLEEMKYITILNALFRLIMLVSVFVFIREPSDGIKFAFVSLSYYIFMSIASQLVVYNKLSVKYRRVDFAYIKVSFVDGYSIFISSIFIALKDRLNIIVVGIVFGPSQVIIYDIALKVISVLSIPQNIILTAFFPQVVNKREVSLIKKLFISICGFNIIIVTTIYIVFPYIAAWLLPNVYVEDFYVIYILLTSVVFVGVSSSIGRLILLPFGYDKLLAKTVVVNCILYFLFMFTYVYFVNDKSLIEFSCLILTIYITEIYLRGWAAFSVFKNEKGN